LAQATISIRLPFVVISSPAPIPSAATAMASIARALAVLAFLPASFGNSYQALGIGYCRESKPIGERVVKAASGSANAVNGYRKDGVSAEDCKSACDSQPKCVGYAIEANARSRCYVYGSKDQVIPGGWDAYAQDAVSIGAIGGATNACCYKVGDDQDADDGSACASLNAKSLFKVAGSEKSFLRQPGAMILFGVVGLSVVSMVLALLALLRSRVARSEPMAELE